MIAQAYDHYTCFILRSVCHLPAMGGWGVGAPSAGRNACYRSERGCHGGADEAVATCCDEAIAG
jgi:hypothetical protein